MTEKGPWASPQITEPNIDFLLSSLREVHAAIDSLTQKKKRLVADLQKAHENGQLNSYSGDKDNSYKYDGVTFTLQKGRTKLTWDPEVQKALDRIEYEARRLGKYTESQGSPYWVTRLEKPL